MLVMRIPAAVAAAAAFVASILVTVPAAARDRAVRADVTLQVVPRGLGSITSGANSCSNHEEPGDCTWTFPSGTTVVLSAKPDAGESFSRWSTPDCPGTGDCRLTLDADTTIVALFGRLQLNVDTSGIGDDDFITIDPGGLRCPSVCNPRFAPGTVVTLTVTTKAPSVFTSFPYGCESVSGTKCTLTINDDGQQVGVKFNNAEGPVAGPVVKVKVRVSKGGDGTGKVSANGLDCGNTCIASFSYGTLATFAADASGGSYFGGWGGVCADDKNTRCTLPIGPVTLIRPRFARDAPPATPGAITVTAATRTSVTVAWGASTDDVGLKAYDVYVGGSSSPRTSVADPTATIDGLTCGTSYEVTVEATDTAGNHSERVSATVSTAACPLRVTLVVAPRVTGPTRMICSVRATVATRGVATVVVRGNTVLRKGVVLPRGVTTLAWRVPRTAAASGGLLRLRLADPSGGVQTYTWAFKRRR
jgi:hypothetical protein